MSHAVVSKIKRNGTQMLTECALIESRLFLEAMNDLSELILTLIK